ncbi:hypothetical protein ACSSUR_07840 [Pseudomonas cedrina]|uniref:hypothetical protein n=1 Tax=Pseudomonas cedrina TaxID=651740 RepID=UPI003EDA7C67
MILLTDNDILIKLSQCDLVETALDVFQCSLADCYVLDTAKHSLYLSNPDKCIERRLGSAAAYGRLAGLIDGCRELGAAGEDIDFLEELMDVEGIDAGELSLLMHAHGLNQSGSPFHFTTGDKRALMGIASSQSERAKRLLHQKVDCVESILLKAIHMKGFDEISGKIISAMQVTDPKKFDTVMRMSFGEGRSKDHAHDCLVQYLNPVLQFIRP